MGSSAHKPVAQYERRDVEQFQKLTANRPGPGAPDGNRNRLKHGVYANRFLFEEELSIYEDLVSRLRDDFLYNDSTNFVQVELVAIYYLKLSRALEHDDFAAAMKLDSMLRGHMKDLRKTNDEEMNLKV